MKRHLFTPLLLVLLLPFTGNSQNTLSLKEKYVDINPIPRPDCSGKTGIWHDYNKNTVKLIVIPDSLSDITLFNRMVLVIKEGYPDSLIRRESELRPEDFNHALKIFLNT